jgi:hypothetical protein
MGKYGCYVRGKKDDLYAYIFLCTDVYIFMYISIYMYVCMYMYIFAE